MAPSGHFISRNHREAIGYSKGKWRVKEEALIVFETHD